MIILKHVEHGARALKTASEVDSVEFKDIYFPKGKDECILVMECVNEEKYLEWRAICPLPPDAKDWYEVMLLEDERFSK
jgi:hypothetical protein